MSGCYICEFPQPSAAHKLSEHKDEKLTPRRRSPILGPVAGLGYKAFEIPLWQKTGYLREKSWRRLPDGQHYAVRQRLPRDANKFGATVFSVEYTLATDPSYTYHIELDEAYAGLAYVYEHADELHIDGNNIVLMGESAGGGLTTRMALWNKDKGNVPVKGALLIYPMLDYRTGGPDDLYNDDMTGEFVWTKEDNVLGWSYLKHGQDIPADEMIYYSPAVASPEQLKGFPATFLLVGSLDLFVHEDKAFVEQLSKAGVQADLFVESGVPHSYNVMLSDSPQTIRVQGSSSQSC